MGVGRLLYSRIYEWAAQSQLLTICAEMNLDPPNHESLRFHDKAGFVQMGTRRLENGKCVSMQIRPTINELQNV
ncbi:acetyltransferase GNAT family protein [Rhodopirellula maiorica SM1]|uniref:Acetyltransferase GNAT family protein n=2 Tax=Novipirellula TaxID=2795426 RepID=M5RTP7_9BACT|nr:acetyltransferase GNAT family protein [Rhodopirellula maiorica SM1]